MMKLGTIQLGGHTIDIETMPVLIDEDNKIMFGAFKHSENKIYISEQSGKQMSQALLHEIVHAIDYIFNNDALSEDEVDGIAQGLYQLLKGGDVFKTLMNEGYTEATKGGD